MSRHGHEPLDATERELARRLAQLDANASPSPALDAAILAAARATPAGSGAPPQAAPTRMRRRLRRWPAGLGIAASLAVAVGVAWQLRPLPETSAVPTPTEAGPLQEAVPERPQGSPLDAPPPPMAEMAMPAPADAPAQAPDAAPATRQVPPVPEVAQEAGPAPLGPPAAVSRTRVSPPPDADIARQTPVDRPTAARAAAAAAAAQAQEDSAQARAARARNEARRAQATAPATRDEPPAIALDRRPAPPPSPPAPPAPAPKASAPAPTPAEPLFVPAPPPPAAAVPAEGEAEAQRHPQQQVAPAARPAQSTTPDAVDAFADQPLDEQPPASADSPAVRETWLQRIRELRETGRLDEARASLREFVRRHPQAAVPDDLRPLLEE